MCVQGVSDVVPIHLMEHSPVQFSSFVFGIAYQLGNLIFSASSTIEAKAGQHFPKKTLIIHSADQEQYDYSKVMAIILSCVYVYLFILIFFGPEKRNIDEVTDSNTTNNKHDETYNDIQLKESSTFDELIITKDV